MGHGQTSLAVPPSAHAVLLKGVAKMSTPISRREVMRRSLLGVAGLWLADGVGVRGVPAGASQTTPHGVTTNGKAKSVIQIWMWGGPCHIDTFDPKPEAGNDFTGPLSKTIETNVSGIRIGELMPLL